jgi:integrase
LADQNDTTPPLPAARPAKKRARKGNLTDATVAGVVFEAGTSNLHWDKGDECCKGFFVRVTPAGGKSYGVQYTIAGAKKRLSLGPVEKWKSVDDARAQARALRDRLQKEGIDPAAGSDSTMQGVWDVYVAGLRTGMGRKRMKGVPAAEKTILDAQSAWKTHFKTTVGSKSPKDITSDFIHALHTKISTSKHVVTEGRGSRKRGGPYAANRSIAYLQSAWRASASTGLTKGLLDPFTGLTRNHEKARTEYIKRNDAPRFFEAINREPDHLRAYWITMISVGARGAELRNLLWEDVDLNSKAPEAIFRDTKNGTAHSVGLPAHVVKLLKTLPRQGTHVFPFSYPDASWARVRKRTGFATLRPHDVRRTVGTWLGGAGLSSKAVGALLGHKSDITSKVYIQLSNDEETKRAAAKSQAQLITKYAGKVISLDDARRKRVKARGKGRPKKGAA